MNELILTRYIHFISIMIVFAMVAAELVLVQKTVSRSVVKKLFVVDGIYGAFSLILVGAGLYMWLGGIGKPVEFYNQNVLLHLKVGLFLMVGILSLWPTRYYFKHRKGDSSDQLEIPKFIKSIILVELIILIIVPVLAVFLARGYGVLN